MLKRTMLKRVILAVTMIGIGLAGGKLFTNNKTTVKQVVTNTCCGYIVKDTNTMAILEANRYMNENVVDIAICDDTENTLCLFVTLDENDEVFVRVVE